MSAWLRREGFIGQLLAKHVAYVPPPAGMPSPLLWGDQAVIEERFDEQNWRVTATRRTLTFRYPHSGAGIADLFRETYGPTVRGRSRRWKRIGEDYWQRS